MSLSLDASPDAEFLRFAARFCGVSVASAASGPVRARLGKSELHRPATIAKLLARQADREAELLGESPLERAQVAMWVDFAAGLALCPPAAAPAHCAAVDAALQTRTFLVANRVTLADAAVFWAARGAVEKLNSKQRAELVSLVRWFDQLQHTVGVRGFRGLQVLDLGRQQCALQV